MSLKSILKGTYVNIREPYVFPVVKTPWKQQQQETVIILKARQGGTMLAGDGSCDFLDNLQNTYCTYTFLDVEMVDFDVVSVSQVADSNQMVKRDFVTTLGNTEDNSVKVDSISTNMAFGQFSQQEIISAA